jgi:DNA replication initiation complex subunit (GINS family)
MDYNGLYDILRKEKYNETLQPLSKEFFDEVSTFIKELREQANAEADLFMGAPGKPKKQLENSVALFKELMRIRKKKILNLAFVATETGIMKRDYENMLVIEKQTFDALVKIFEESEKNLTQSLNGKKEIEKSGFRMILLNQDIDSFVDMTGALRGPFVKGQLVNIEKDLADLFVADGKGAFIE